jgi:hypothetical protein
MIQLFADLYHMAREDRLDQAEPIAQFSSYLESERGSRETGRYAKAGAYWKEKLDKKPDLLTFYGKAFDRDQIEVLRIHHDIGPERSEKVRAIAANDKVLPGPFELSVCNVFLTVVSAYIHCISGSRRFGLGIPFHNRRGKKFKRSIGPFMHIMPLIAHVEKEDTFQSLMDRMRLENRNSLRYGEYPLGNRLLDQSYSVEFNYVPIGYPTLDGAQIAGEWLHPGHGTEALAIQFHDLSKTGSYTAEFDFNLGIFDHALQEQTLIHFDRVLDAFLDNLDHAIDETALLWHEDQKQRKTTLEEEATFDFDF